MLDGLLKLFINLSLQNKIFSGIGLWIIGKVASLFTKANFRAFKLKRAEDQLRREILNKTLIEIRMKKEILEKRYEELKKEMK